MEEIVYEGIIEKPNVVVVGNSGVGKSTLINALLQSYEAETGTGEAVTKNIRVHENDALGFRLIDTIGFEPGFLNQNKSRQNNYETSRLSIC